MDSRVDRIGILALIAIIIILWIHDTEPLPNRPFGITINALVSVFAVILKVTLMAAVAESVGQLKWSWFRKPQPLSDLAKFDLASRGAWGSITLIGRLRGMHLSSLGAVITVLAAAIDPFIQQVIQNSACPQIVPGVAASLPRTNDLVVSTVTEAGYIADIPETLKNQMEAALYTGVINSSFPMQPDCTIGNCTYPTFRTSGGCQDISNTLNLTIQHIPRLAGDVEDLCTATWQLPPGGQYGQNLTSIEMMTMRPESNWATFPVITNIIYNNASSEVNWSPVTGYAGNCTSLPQIVTALECSLYTCVRTYNSTVSGGQLSETLLSTEHMTLNLSQPGEDMWVPHYYYSAAPMPCLMNSRPYNASSFTRLSDTNWIPISGLLENNKTGYVPSECYFAIDNTARLTELMHDFLIGEIYYDDEVEGRKSFSDPPWLDQIYADGNATFESINATWTAIADSMSVAIRQMPDALNLTALRGDSWRTETCISVQYAWLAFPATLLVLTILLLLATIIKSARDSRQNTWKSSPLALLFHGLDNDLREKYHEIDQINDMDRTAKRLLVKLRPGEGGLKFVEALKDGNSLGPVKKQH